MYTALHVRPVTPDRRPVAVCTCVNQRVACPLHDALTYAMHYARHATDSIGPF